MEGKILVKCCQVIRRVCPAATGHSMSHTNPITTHSFGQGQGWGHELHVPFSRMNILKKFAGVEWREIFCRDLYDRLLLYFCPLCAALLLKASNRHQYGPRLLRSHRAAAGFFPTRSKPELCALDWMLLTPHIVIVKSVCVDVGPVVCFPGAVVPLFLWRRDSSGVDLSQTQGQHLGLFSCLQLSRTSFMVILGMAQFVCVGLLLTITFVA